MALVNCNLSTLQAAAKCFDCLSATEKLALQVRIMAELYKQGGGTDLTNINVLHSTVSCLTCEPDFTLDSMVLATWNSAALGRVSGWPTTIQGLRALISCVPCGEQKSTRAALVYLWCQLSRQLLPAT